MKKLVILLILPLLVASILPACGGPTTGTAEWHSEQALELNKQGRYDEAIEECNKAIELDPSYADAYYNRGCAYLELGQKMKSMLYTRVSIGAAKIDFEKCIELSKNTHLTLSAKVMLRETTKMIESY